jgi:hypothetical protein
MLFAIVSFYQRMSDFNLNLSGAESHLEEATGDRFSGNVILGILDGDTDPTEWLAAIEAGNVLMLNVDGDLNELAEPFARPVVDLGGNLTHFRGFLIITPPDAGIDTDRL